MPRPVQAMAIALTTAVLIAGCAGDDDESPDQRSSGTSPESTSSPDDDEPEVPIGQGEIDFEELETVATGLEVPWALAFVDDDTVLVTERPGRVRVIEGGRLRPEPALELAVDGGQEGGLLGIALHPEYPAEAFAYVYYTGSDDNRVSRFRVSEDLGLDSEEVLIGGIPSARTHNGGTIAFGPDGMLYVTTGDSRRAEQAADVESLAGKILRIAPDGGVPPDNPFEGSPVYSYGHRNAQGLGWDADGNLYVSEHGPSGDLDLCCHDEINLIEPGAFYGWPFVAGTVDGLPGDPPEEPIAPIATSGDETWAPAGLAVHTPAGRLTTLLVANLRSQQLLRFVVADDSPGEIASTTPVLSGLGRLRAATFGPDGCLYLTTSNRDGRGTPGPMDDRVLRTCPAGE